MNDLTNYYQKWYKTKPLKLEDTILVVFNSIINGSDPYIASQSMPHSQTNTGLMRIFPLAVFTSCLPD
jgi:ADP-ribosylglycohydrolase